MRSLKLAITTSQSQTSILVNRARLIARELEAPYIARDGRSLDAISAVHGVEGMVVVSPKRVSCVTRAGEFFFHPGLARMRINELKAGKTDQMIEAMSISPGDTVLDCTTGLGTDAIVASFVTGASGRVIGLESSAVIAFLVNSGIAVYPEVDEGIAAAMRRVQVIHADHREHLRMLPPGSFDVVYFDPMFRMPGRKSPAINVMRSLADPDPIEQETILLALRVAAKRVVLKEGRNSSEFARLGFNKIIGGRYAPIVYGVMNGQGASNG
ncbi:MAG: Ribosomal RNA small subunit methyltransferase J [Pelotomaculum sp. PtaB.Bin104]|nr:MAG: Ribosomal RNA small subunit methyltransferase J [Pelotomaculum sp. PtaB.Bin104]